MNPTKYFHALAGLLADPLLADQQEKIVPAQWLEKVKQARVTASLASKLAAGVDKNAVKGDIAQSLQSVFSNIHTPEGNIPATVFWPQASLRLNDQVVMPDVKKKPSSKPWTDFLAEAGTLKSVYEGAPDESLPLFIENLSLMMQKHLWCLPSSYADVLPDVSLYDHSRMTAALAAAMTEWEKGKPVAQLVGGDLSGVQKFIYTISSSGATSALRGRSFYLQLLTDATARYILRNLDLPITSLVYAGGGNFYLLAPAGADLKPLREYISRVLLYHHSGDLYLAVGALDLQEQDFYEGKIARCWQALTDNLNRVKLQPFSELGDGLKVVFEPQGHGGDENLQCQVCGLEHPDTKVEQVDDPQKEGKRKCPPCISYEEDLGKDLRKAQFLLYETIEETALFTGVPVPGTWDQVLAHFGLRVKPSDSMPRSNGQESVLFALDDDAARNLRPTKTQAVGRRFMVNVTPEISRSDLDELSAAKFEPMPKAGDIKPYDVMEYQSQGIKRLGVMRMDVDNLHEIISKGFGEEASLSRIGALSFAVSLFFEGWVAKLAEDINAKDKSDGRGERLYSIYSGGDDLFFVGAWDAVIELTRQIRADLSRYAGNHPGVHASAGVVLVGGKYPLYQAAQDAGKAEEDAKEYQWYAGETPRTKDSITFLGQTMSWQQFGLQKCDNLNQQTVHAWSHRLQQAQKDTPRALLGLLIRLQESYDSASEKRRLQGADLNQERKTQTIWGPWNWLGVYYLKRMQKRLSDPAFKDLLQDILNLMQSGDFSSIQWIGLAARWAQLLTR